MDYESLCKSILDIDPLIRYVGSYHQNGDLISNSIRKGIRRYFTDEQISKIAKRLISRRMSRKNFYKPLGAARYTLVEFPKMTRITINLNNNKLLLITTEPNSNHSKIIKKILKFVDAQK